MPINRMENGIASLKARMIVIDEFDVSVVPTINDKTYTYQPPVGHIWKITNMYINCNPIPAATSGEHNITVNGGNIAILRGISAYNKIIMWNFSHWYYIDSQYPLDNVSSLMALHNSTFSHEYPINITYMNTSDEPTSGGRLIRLYINEQSILN